MPIARTELKQYKSAVVDETTSNGGIMEAVPVVSNVLNNVFPNVSKADRLAGLTTYRKIFIKNTNLLLSLIDPLVWVDTITPGDDYITMFPGTQSDTVNDLTGTERKYGCASLQADVLAGASTFVVEVESAALATGTDAIFGIADTIRITNKSTIDSGVGTDEEFLIDDITTGYLGNPLHILIDIGASVLANSYAVVDTPRVMSVYQHTADLVSSVDAAVPTSVAGTIDDTTYPIVTNNIGTFEDTVTLTFTSASEFSVASDAFGALSAGSIISDYTYNNPNFSGSVHFTLPKLAWGGTWAIGDEVTFDLHPAAMPIWRKRKVPAGSGSLSGNKTVLVFGGESA